MWLKAVIIEEHVVSYTVVLNLAFILEINNKGPRAKRMWKICLFNSSSEFFINYMPLFFFCYKN
jgi:hypothetical protein